MVKIKICGMTNLADCIKAVDLGVDFIGFVFYSQSKRRMTPAEVRPIIEALGGSVRTVGVFVEESDREIEETVRYCRLDFCQVFRELPLANAITVYRVNERIPEVPLSDHLVLLDTYTESFGGSGKAFDLSLLDGVSFLPRAFIAGGISEENVEAVLRLKPFAVDLVSSLEASPGKKNHYKMETFVNTVRSLVL